MEVFVSPAADHSKPAEPRARGVLFRLEAVDFDPFGRVRLADRDAVGALEDLFEEADALACRSGCGAPLSCDTALIDTRQLIRIGPDLIVNNADFASIIRKRKAVNAREAVIVFESYKALI